MTPAFKFPSANAIPVFPGLGGVVDEIIAWDRAIRTH